MKSQIDVYFREKGFGFGNTFDQEGNRTKFYFHISDVIQGYPVADAEIKCVLEESPKGYVAKQIRVLPPQTGSAS